MNKAILFLVAAAVLCIAGLAYASTAGMRKLDQALSQSVNRLELNETDREFLQILIEIQEMQRQQRERTANLPACPIDPSRYWNLSCA
jgi:cytochrome c-type biogenesis protein CcmH/NrfG